MPTYTLQNTTGGGTSTFNSSVDAREAIETGQCLPLEGGFVPENNTIVGPDGIARVEDSYFPEPIAKGLRDR